MLEMDFGYPSLFAFASLILDVFVKFFYSYWDVISSAWYSLFYFLQSIGLSIIANVETSDLLGKKLKFSKLYLCYKRMCL